MEKYPNKLETIHQENSSGFLMRVANLIKLPFVKTTKIYKSLKQIENDACDYMKQAQK
jgi:hypothetical protein